MTLSREVVVPGMLNEYASFADLVRGLSDRDWATPSRCEGWQVADVAAHVIGQLTDVVNLRLEGLGSADVTARQVGERRGRAPGELADELEASAKAAGDLSASFDDEAWTGPIPGGATGATLGFGLEALWFDTYLHADDIRQALGLGAPSPEGLAPSLSHIAQVLTDQGWGAADLEFPGVGDFPVSGGGERTISGDAFAFVLAATGRGDPGPLGLDETVNIYR